MASQRFFPESRYSRTHLPNWEQNANEFINTIVHVKPRKYLPGIGLFVYGDNFEGLIPTKELSIYTNQNPSRLAGILVGRKFLVTAQICSISGDLFILSRKKSMEDALQQVYDAMDSNETVSAKILNIQDFTTFLDIGGGISAILPICEVSSTYIEKENLFKYFEGIDSIPVKILNESKKSQGKFVVSYKKAFKPIPISEGDTVKGRIIRDLPDGTGKVVELSPVQSGIVDIGLQSWIHLEIGQSYNFYVTRFRTNDNGVLHYSLDVIVE